ncbi:MAG: DUF3108 domain-containing protein [Methylobacteriaceae bacterium]|nr:DUF3108 domain-containing protein [Methylobacteriaceae bacterium]
MLRILAIFALAASTGAPATAESLKAQYSISLIGLPLGSATLSAEIGPGYTIEAYTKLSGVASMVSNSKGGAKAAGAFANGRPAPASYATTASNSETTRTVRMALGGGAVKGVDISPPFEEKPGRVPLAETHKRGVVDPLSALVMQVPAGQPAVGPAACNRTLPVFDGYTRFDVTLAYVGTRNVKTAGYAGPVSVCAARYVPIAGHRPDRPGTKFMAENRQMEAWLAPVGTTGVVVPYRIAVRTMVGTTVIEAKEFVVSGQTQKAAQSR